METRAEGVLRVRVVYATADKQVVRDLAVSTGTCVRDAVSASGLLERFPEIRPPETAVGIFGRRVGWDDPVADGDRVEIYRPLRIDPKEARRRRARVGSGRPPRAE